MLPLVISAADEDRDELQEIWARLLAAAADPARAKSFRIQFIEVAKQMDPLALHHLAHIAPKELTLQVIAVNSEAGPILIGEFQFLPLKF